MYYLHSLQDTDKEAWTEMFENPPELLTEVCRCTNCHIYIQALIDFDFSSPNGQKTWSKSTKLRNPGIVWDTQQPLLIITKYNTW